MRNPVLRPKNRQMQAELAGDAVGHRDYELLPGKRNHLAFSFQFLEVGSFLQLGDFISQPGIAAQKDCQITNMDRPGSDVSGIKITHPALPVGEVRVVEP